MDVKLVVMGGKKPGQEIAVPGPKFLIGRADDCQLRPRSDMVSRRHCAILTEEGSVKIRDFGSKNGTFVNGEKVVNERELKNGDRLKVGPLEFEVQLAVRVGGKKKPKVQSVQEAAARTVQSANDELDITNWLEDDEDTVSGAIGGKKAAPSVARTDPGDTKAQAPHEPPDDTKKEDVKKAQKIVGRFQVNKPAAENSRSAAADMLNKFFQRRP